MMESADTRIGGHGRVAVRWRQIMSSIRTALGIITLVTDLVAVFQIVRKAVLRCVASYKRAQRFALQAI